MADNDHIFNKHDTLKITEEERMRDRIKDLDRAMEDVACSLSVVHDEMGDNDSMIEELEGLILALRKEKDEIWARLGS